MSELLLKSALESCRRTVGELCGRVGSGRRLASLARCTHTWGPPKAREQNKSRRRAAKEQQKSSRRAKQEQNENRTRTEKGQKSSRREAAEQQKNRKRADKQQKTIRK